MDILAVTHSNVQAELYALYGKDQVLWLYDSSTGKYTRVAELELENPPIVLYYHEPYICVSERFGLRSTVVNRISGAVYEFSREAYHNDVSSYSIGFIERGGTTLLLHQTKWNRLDLTDLATGKLMTDREVSWKEIEPGYQDADGKWIPRKVAYTNYLDYFQSMVTVSPDSKSFLSNGWLWGPCDNIRTNLVEEFLQRYEPASIEIDYGHGYNWDRPCAFVDNDVFVVVQDNNAVDDSDDDELRQRPYHPFALYRLSDRECSCLTASFRSFSAAVYPVDPTDGEIHGDLWYDSGLGCLVALSSTGAYALDLDGNILWHDARLLYTSKKVFGNAEETIALQPYAWSYHTGNHCFYRYDRISGRIVTKPLVLV